MIPLLLALLTGQETTFRATVPVVAVPVTVTDRSGRPVNGLGADDFVLLDDGTPQRFAFDTADTIAAPLAVVIAVQANNTAPAALRKIQKVGSMIEPLITGERGRAAVVAFGAEVRVAQDFTNDAGDLTRAFRELKHQRGKQARMLDAVFEGVRMLAARPDGERRTVIVISESRDRGSETGGDEVVRAAQMAGVSMFGAAYSAFVTPFTTKASDLPPSEGGMDLLGAIGELGRMGKKDTLEMLAASSGGRKVSFATLRGLEGVLTSLGEELHSQYILTYTSPRKEAGFHRIRVEVPRVDAVVRARAGYWINEESGAHR